jgi:hypothetical protein
MGASFGYASADSLDMPWLPLSRFESRAVGVPRVVWVRGARRGCHTQYPLEVGQTHTGKAVDGRIV